LRTFPTWNTYPGLFAALSTGNAVIVKPHSNAILPAAITVRTIRAVLAENGIDPNLVTLCVAAAAPRPRSWSPIRRSIDFTGGNVFGQWLVDNCRQARVYAELAGVEQHRHRLDRRLQADAAQPGLHAGALFRPDVHHLAGHLRAGRRHRDRRRPQVLRRVCADLAKAVSGFLAKPEVALAVLGAVQSADTLKRIEMADSGTLGKVVLASTKLDNPEFPKATVRTPVLLACDAADEHAYMEERFGPISFIVKVADTAAAIALSERIVATHGALTAGILRPSRK
jgi:phenylacetic acid degradation protein paaN